MEVMSCILLLVLPLSCVGVEGREDFFSKSGEGDVTFDGHLLVSLAVTSKLGCARQCSRSRDCVTFTFTKGSPSGTCRLHSEVMTSRCPRSEAPGSTTYTKTQEAGPPVISACADDSDCATCIGFECFFGQCLCTPGYYFSVGSKICTETCDETDLQQNYMRYAVSGLVGYNIAAYTPRTLEECQQLCSNDTACRTFEYMDQLGQCVLQAVTPMDTPWAWNRGNDLGWDLYQRMCA